MEINEPIGRWCCDKMTASRSNSIPSNNLTGDLHAKYKSERSFFGYTPHVLKSGIQKYGRRADVDKGLWCLTEMDLFSLLEWEGDVLDAYLMEYPDASCINVQRSAQRIRTNMINRLVVMMSEEVNISAWWMPAKIMDLYQKWIENRGDPCSRKILVDIYLYLVSQRMIRLVSDLKSVYTLPPYYVKSRQMNDFRQIHRSVRSVYPAVYANQTDVGDVDWDLNGYPANLRPCIKGIIYNFEAGSDHAFYWISKLCDLEKADGTSKYRYLRIVWPVLHSFIDRHHEYEFVRETVSALEFFFRKMGHQEKPIYLYHALLLLVRRNEIDWGSIDPGIDTPIADVKKLYKAHIVDGKMPMDDYILDLHTHGGKRGRDDLENFALEGAYIKNENKGFLRHDYRKIYVVMKQELDCYRNNGLGLQQKRWKFRMLSNQVGVPIKAISADVMAKLWRAPHAQLRTAKFKKAVYIVEKLVLKGPYAIDDPRLMNNLRYTYAVKLLEDALKLPESLRGSLPWKYVGCCDGDKFYLASVNVGIWKNIPFERVSSKIETDVPVVPRGGVVWRVSDVEKNGPLANGIKLAALQHLYFRFLLDIGDSGTHNILIRDDNDTSGRLIAGIDLEEKRSTHAKKTRFEHLFKRAPSKRQVQLYQTGICKIKSLSCGQLSRRTIDRLDAVGIDLERLEASMETWNSLNGEINDGL